MLWFIVWSVLVVGTLGVGFLLWRRVYRAAQATMVEVNRGTDVVAGLADQVDALRGGFEPFVVQPGLSLEPRPARATARVARRTVRSRLAARRPGPPVRRPHRSRDSHRPSSPVQRGRPAATAGSPRRASRPRARSRR